MKGRQIGTLLDASGKNGIQVTIDSIGDPTYQRITNGSISDFKGYCMLRDKYDERQGSMVAGVLLCDASGNPITNEHYRLNEFTWAGNISYGGGSPISFL